jgi:iron(III) transport system substrate-binding protein
MNRRIESNIFLATMILVLCLPGCWRSSPNEVVVYTALDSEFSGPILDRFGREADATPLPVFDAESTKTVGLVNRIRQEKKRPRCDVFWNNEILHTILLEREGLLEPYSVASKINIRDGYESRTGSWTAFAARARVILVNTDKLPDANAWPKSVEDLAADKWAQQCTFARPFFGSTKTHFLTLFDKWGPKRSAQFFTKLRENSVMVDGNKQVAQAVARGQLAFGLTDTDDAIVEIENGSPVAIVFPDQGENGMGTLFIPNTAALVRDGPNPKRGRQLLDFLASRETERQLASGESAQFPILGGDAESRLTPEEGLRWMDVDFEQVADNADAGLKAIHNALGK